MKELVSILRQVGKAYYQESRKIVNSFEYDKLYDELSPLERKIGIIISGSPARKVRYEALSELPKEAHDFPMLSLDKTKNVKDLRAWLRTRKGLLFWKMDSLIIVLTYEEGNLQKAVIRGNGEIGEMITASAKVFSNIPLSVSCEGQLALRGEAVIVYSDFRRINEEIEDMDARYRDSRNLYSDSVRQFDSQITAEWGVYFEALTPMRVEGTNFGNSRKRQFGQLGEQGFEVAAFTKVTAESLPEAVKESTDAVGGNDIPSDGLVFVHDDITYGESLGRTMKFPRNSIVPKWWDEIWETRLDYIE